MEENAQAIESLLMTTQRENNYINEVAHLSLDNQNAIEALGYASIIRDSAKKILAGYRQLLNHKFPSDLVSTGSLLSAYKKFKQEAKKHDLQPVDGSLMEILQRPVSTAYDTKTDKIYFFVHLDLQTTDILSPYSQEYDMVTSSEEMLYINNTLWRYSNEEVLFREATKNGRPGSFVSVNKDF